MSGHTYIHGLAASATPQHAVGLELGSILAARRDLCAVECSQIVAGTVPCSCATYCEPGSRRMEGRRKTEGGREGRREGGKK